MNYSDNINEQNEVNCFLAEDNGESAAEKHEFIMNIMFKILKYGELIPDNDKERLEICTQLAEIADDYKAFIKK